MKAATAVNNASSVNTEVIVAVTAENAGVTTVVATGAAETEGVVIAEIGAVEIPETEALVAVIKAAEIAARIAAVNLPR